MNLDMLEIDPKEVGNRETFKYLVGTITPRPIAFVSTISKDGINNLSPFSFFNVFGSNPPIVAFSPSRRGTNNTVKDTYNNLNATKECVVHIVNYDLVEKMNLASSEFDENVDEFVKAGFTAIDSDLVAPKRAAESPVHMECKLQQIIELGGQAGSGNLCICEVVKIHVSKDILNEKGLVDPFKLDAVGRNGGMWYTRANKHSMFEVPKPAGVGIGFDGLPKHILESHIYSANNLGVFAMTERIPFADEVQDFIREHEPMVSTEESFYLFMRMGDYQNMLRSALYLKNQGNPKYNTMLELTSKTAIEARDLDFAWKTAMHSQEVN
jgi:flavin reductase (DIM6/NTAB) family NADH-FMN oxidoreductase RutF